jgi:hypothetical protein
MAGQNRWAGRANPADLTGTRQRQLIAKAQADKAAGELTAADVAEIRRTERDAGHTSGYMAAIDAIHDLYRREGIKAIAEFMDELDDVEPEDA